MDRDRIEGKAKELGGKGKAALGKMTGDTPGRIEGNVDRVSGKVQNALEDLYYRESA